MASDGVDLKNITTALWCFIVGTSWWVAILCGVRCGRHREHYYSSVVFCCRVELVGGRSLWYQMW